MNGVKLRSTIYMAVLIAALVAGALLHRQFDKPRDVDAREIVLGVLRTVPRSFLVVLTQETMAVNHRDDGNWLLGPRRGQSSILVRIHWGVDLGKIGRGDIEVAGNRVVVRLPEPEILDQVPDLDTWRYVGKRTPLQIILDGALGRSLEIELLMAIKGSLPRYGPDDYNARRAAIVDRLNHGVGDLFDGQGLDVEFR